MTESNLRSKARSPALVLLALLAAPQTAAGQETVTIGTTPGAPTAVEKSSLDTAYDTQTFIAAGTHLRRLTFWFYGGAYTSKTDCMEEEHCIAFWSYLFVGKTTDPTSKMCGSPCLFGGYLLDQDIQGRFDYVFADPLPMTMGEVYQFSIMTDQYWGWGPPGHPRIGPRIEVTTVDAYEGGMYHHTFGDPVPGRDIRFEAEFSTVPEPATTVLLATGLLGLGLIAWSQRERDDAA